MQRPRDEVSFVEAVSRMEVQLRAMVLTDALAAVWVRGAAKDRQWSCLTSGHVDSRDTLR